MSYRVSVVLGSGERRGTHVLVSIGLSGPRLLYACHQATGTARVLHHEYDIYSPTTPNYLQLLAKLKVNLEKVYALLNQQP